MNERRLAHPGALTPAETDAFRSVVSRPRDLVAVSLMLDAGLRASEVVGLRLEDIDWGTQTLRFVGKGGKPAELPISSRLREEIERAIAARPPQAISSRRLGTSSTASSSRASKPTKSTNQRRSSRNSLV